MVTALVSAGQRTHCAACNAKLPMDDAPRIRCYMCGAAYDLLRADHLGDGPHRSAEAYELRRTTPPPDKSILDWSGGARVRHITVKASKDAIDTRVPVQVAIWAGVGMIWMTIVFLTRMDRAWLWIGWIACVAAMVAGSLLGDVVEEIGIDRDFLTHRRRGVLSMQTRHVLIDDITSITRASGKIILGTRDGERIAIGTASSLNEPTLDWLHSHLNDGVAIVREARGRPSPAPPGVAQ